MKRFATAGAVRWVAVSLMLLALAVPGAGCGRARLSEGVRADLTELDVVTVAGLMKLWQLDARLFDADPECSRGGVEHGLPCGLGGPELPDDLDDHLVGVIRDYGEARHPEVFAGLVAFGQYLYAGFTDDARGHLRHLRAELGENGWHVRAFEARYSLRELERLQAKWTELPPLEAQGVRFTGGGIDEVGNVLEVGVDPLTPEVEAIVLRELDAPPGAVRVVQEARIQDQ